MRGLRGKAYTRYQRERIIRRRMPLYPWVDKPGKLARHSYRYRCTCEWCADTRHAHVRRRWKRAAWREIEQAWRDCDECLREIRLFGRERNMARWPPNEAAIMFER